jgi:hypothetical protein
MQNLLTNTSIHILEKWQQVTPKLSPHMLFIGVVPWWKDVQNLFTYCFSQEIGSSLFHVIYWMHDPCWQNAMITSFLLIKSSTNECQFMPCHFKLYYVVSLPLNTFFTLKNKEINMISLRDNIGLNTNVHYFKHERYKLVLSLPNCL